MPQDDHKPTATDERLAAIKADLDYFKKACAQMGGGQPPTVYANKYAQDVEYLMSLLPNVKPAQAAKVTEVEVALRDDAAGRVERNPKRG